MTANMKIIWGVRKVSNLATLLTFILPWNYKNHMDGWVVSSQQTNTQSPRMAFHPDWTESAPRPGHLLSAAPTTGPLVIISTSPAPPPLCTPPAHTVTKPSRHVLRPHHSGLSTCCLILFPLLLNGCWNTTTCLSKLNSRVKGPTVGGSN